MEISPRELRDTDIHSEMRGYNRDEVNDLLERAAATIDAANARVAQMQERLGTAQAEAGRTRETEEILHRTLLLAQRAADEAVAEATTKSRQMLDDAEISSRRLVADAEAEARRKGESERRRLEEEILDLAGRRDVLLADVEALTRFEAEYRERMVRALEADLFALRSRPTSAPGSRPEPSEVEMPVPSAMTATDSPGATMTFNDASNPAPAPDAVVADEPAFEAAPAPAPNPAPEASSEASSAPDATHEVDVRSLFEQASVGASPSPSANAVAAEPMTGEGPVVATAPGAHVTNAEGLQPIDLLGTDGVDADVLDDDAFFATLRDAVHDDAPLGPREEGDDLTGEHAFFDQDADRGSFRDVFRRRR